MSEIRIRLSEGAKAELDEVMKHRKEPGNNPDKRIERLFRDYIRGNPPNLPFYIGSGIKAYTRLDKTLHIDGQVMANGVKVENKNITDLPIGEEKEGILVSLSRVLRNQLVRCASIEAVIRRTDKKNPPLLTVTDFARGLVMDGLKEESANILDMELNKED